MSNSDSDSDRDDSLGSYSTDNYDVEVYYVPEKKHPFNVSKLPNSEFNSLIHDKLDELESLLDSKKKEQEITKSITFESGKSIKIRFVFTKADAQSSSSDDSDSDDDNTNGKSSDTQKSKHNKDSDDD